MYNLIGYGDNYLKRSWSLCKSYKDGPALTDAGAVDNFLVIAFHLNLNEK